MEVTWKANGPASGSAEGRALRLHWIERDGPRVQKPSGEGFGSTFVRRSVEYELNGSATLDYDHDGFRCTLVIPFRGNVESYSEADRRDNDGES